MKKKIFFVLLIPAVCFSLFSCKTKDTVLYVTGDLVNIRKEASAKSEVLGLLYKGDQVRFVEKSGFEENVGGKNAPWFKVKAAKDRIGWVHGSLLTEDPSRLLPETRSEISGVPLTDPDESGEVPLKYFKNCSGVKFTTKAALQKAAFNSRYRCQEYHFSRKEHETLKQAGFFLKNVDVQKVSNPEYDDMADLYKAYTNVVKPVEYFEFTEMDDVPQYNMTPMFISADYMLHLYHIVFMRMTEDLETRKFYPALRTLTADMLRKSVSGMNSAKDARMKEAYGRTAAFFAVPAGIMGLPVPAGIAKSAAADAAAVQSASGGGRSGVTGVSEDFTQYKPRGHYTKTETLQKYFKTMMWYGRMFFPLKTRAVEGIIIAELLSQKQNIALWESVYIPTSYMVGASDDLDVYDYRKAMKKYLDGGLSSGKYPDERTLKKIREYLASAKESRIISHPTRTGAVSLAEEREMTRGLRFMGQRFVPDSYVLTMLTSPRVGTDASPRNMPRGLDVMAVLGSREAQSLLEPDFDAIPKFKGAFKKLKSEFADYGDDVYGQNIYWSWLDTIRSLFDEPASGLPEFLSKPEWRFRLLSAAHGSWAELRHDTILYAKSSAAEMGGGGAETVFYPGQPRVPKGYIEPNLTFFKRLTALSSRTQSLLGKHGALTDEYKGKLKTFSEVAERLTALVRLQIRGETLSEDDYLFIATCTNRLVHIVLPEGVDSYALEPKDKQMALIADIHSDYFSKRALEVGVGAPREMLVFVKDKNGPRMCLGYVFSYYEFTQPLSERLTDDDWKIKVYKGGGASLKEKEPQWAGRLPVLQ